MVSESKKFPNAPQTGDSPIPHRVDMRVQYRPPESLKSFPGNANTHPDKQVKKLAKVIKRLGFLSPVITDDHSVIMAGHARVQAALLLGLEKIPTICHRDMTEADKRAYVIADNKLAELARWDNDILAKELEFLSAPGLDINLEDLGFDTAEIDLFFFDDAGVGEGSDLADNIPAISDAEPVVTCPGDLWLLGDHKIYCGNALDSVSYDALMADERADMVFADPPYNVAIDGHVCGSGSIRHAEFAMASGEMSEAEFIAFLKAAFGHMAGYSRDGSVHYIFIDWRHLDEALTAGKSVYNTLLNFCVWAKTNGGMGSFYRSQHELVLVFRKGTVQHRNNVQLGKHGRNRTNLWTYQGVNIPTKEARELLALHPTVKPVQLVADAILDCTKRGEIVLDPFIGSGTTILAAERTGRVARGIELEPRYVDVAIRRYRDMTGIEAILAETGETFAEVQARRLKEDEKEADHG